jgi:hypothetical protein
MPVIPRDRTKPTSGCPNCPAHLIEPRYLLRFCQACKKCPQIAYVRRIFQDLTITFVELDYKMFPICPAIGFLREI